MGYDVTMKFKGVKFKKSNAKEIVAVLKKYNRDVLHPNSDWCRFDGSLEHPQDVFEDIGFELTERKSYFEVTDFLRERLGRHEELFKTIEHLMYPNGTITYTGEDDEVWKQRINAKKTEKAGVENNDIVVKGFKVNFLDDAGKIVKTHTTKYTIKPRVDTDYNLVSKLDDDFRKAVVELNRTLLNVEI